jgi:hypothetical protein
MQRRALPSHRRPRIGCCQRWMVTPVGGRWGLDAQRSRSSIQLNNVSGKLQLADSRTTIAVNDAPIELLHCCVRVASSAVLLLDTPFEFDPQSVEVLWVIALEC